MVEKAINLLFTSGDTTSLLFSAYFLHLSSIFTSQLCFHQLYWQLSFYLIPKRWLRGGPQTSSCVSPATLVSQMFHPSPQEPRTFSVNLSLDNLWSHFSYLTSSKPRVTLMSWSLTFHSRRRRNLQDSGRLKTNQGATGRYFPQQHKDTRLADTSRHPSTGQHI